MNESFDDLYRTMAPRVRKLAHQHVPGLTTEEVEVEIGMCLWKAWKTWDPEGGATFDGWWFRVWTTHRSKLIESYFTQKRQALANALQGDDELERVVAEVSASFGIDLAPPCPSADDTTRQVWSLIAQGYLFIEIQNLLGIGRKSFDRIMDGLRTNPEVGALLGV